MPIQPSFLPMDRRFAVLRAAFVAAGLALLLALVFAPATTLFLAGLALAVGLGELFAQIRRGSDDALTGAGRPLEHE